MRKFWGKHLLILTTAAIVGCTAISTPALAAEQPTQQAEEETEIENDTDITKKEESTASDNINNNLLEAVEEEINYAEKTLTITKAGFIADTFNGVDAVYRKGSGDGSNATYSCAAFIKKYYKKVYNVSVYNLFGGSTPKTYEGKKISSVKSPKEGDITYKNGHWSIVKKVNSNNTVTLIEQNWKWNGNQCKINRTVSTSSLKYFRLAK